MGHHHSKPQDAHAQPTDAVASSVNPATADVDIPNHFSVWYKKSWTKIILYLGDLETTDAFCAIRLPAGWYGNLVLIAGPDVEGYPSVANMTTVNKRMTEVSVEFEGGLATGGESPREQIRYTWKGKRGSERYWFALAVGEGANRRVERFEWRRSHGSEVRSLGLTRWGWKLVRVGGRGQHLTTDDYEEDQFSSSVSDLDDSEDGDDPDGKHPERHQQREKTPSSAASKRTYDAYGRASDGSEVVAVWADRKSLTKVGDFQFINSGATGELGHRWAVMAVLSNLLIWQRTMQQSMAAGAAGAAASASTSAAVA